MVLIVDDPDAPDPKAPRMIWVQILKGMNKPTKSQVEAAMMGHIIAEVELVGIFEKSR